MTWTPELTQAVFAAWKAGDSQAQIAKRHGLTRSQVAGKINRCGARGIDRAPKAKTAPPNCRKGGNRGGRPSKDWETYLREPYSAFKARKQMERMNASR